MINSQINLIKHMQCMIRVLEKSKLDGLIKSINALSEEDKKELKNLSGTSVQCMVWEPLYEKVVLMYGHDEKTWEQISVFYQLGGQIGKKSNLLVKEALKYWVLEKNRVPLEKISACGLMNFYELIKYLQHAADKQWEQEKLLQLLDQFEVDQVRLFLNQILDPTLFDKVWQRVNHRLSLDEKCGQIIEKIHQNTHGVANKKSDCAHYIANYLHVITLDKWCSLPYSFKKADQQMCKNYLMNNYLSGPNALTNEENVRQKIQELENGIEKISPVSTWCSMELLHWSYDMLKEVKSRLEEKVLTSMFTGNDNASVNPKEESLI